MDFSRLTVSKTLLTSMACASSDMYKVKEKALKEKKTLPEVKIRPARIPQTQMTGGR